MGAQGPIRHSSLRLPGNDAGKCKVGETGYVAGVDNRTIRVVVETAQAKIVGDLTLPREGYRSRLSDYLNHARGGFIPLADATIISTDPGAAGTVQRDFVAVGTAHALLVYPDEG